MIVKIDKKYIGGLFTLPEFVKKEYLSNKKKHPRMIFIEIHSDKNYGAVAKIYERNDLFERIQETTTEKQRKEFSDNLGKSMKSNKRVDTSKWVKPDEETIRNALIESLFALEILKEDSRAYQGYHGKAKVLYAILHSRSLKNPQSLHNYGIDPYFESILHELKCPVSKKYWIDFDKDFDKKTIENYQVWKAKCLKKMIVPDPNPPMYKDIFKKTLKEISKENKSKDVPNPFLTKAIKKTTKDILKEVKKNENIK